jgi:hypothetical protein
MLVNYGYIYRQKMTLLFPLVFIDKKYLLVNIMEITVWNQGMKKKWKYDVSVLQTKLSKKYNHR